MKGKLSVLILALLAIAAAAPARTTKDFYAGAFAAPHSETRLAGGQTGGGHSTALSWALSADDVTTACVTGANCLQNVYRAAGTCSASSAFTLLTATSLSATAVTFTASTVTPGVWCYGVTVTPGVWCYGVTFGINGLESAKDTVTVTLQPASPSGLVGTPH